MAVMLTGKPVADALSADTARRAGALRQRGVSPRLVILRCGENEADGAYIRGAVKRGALCGVEVELRALPADATAADVREAIREINGDGSVHGCLLLRPLPPHLRAEEDGICACLDPRKDVDGMTPASAAGVYTGAEFSPARPKPRKKARRSFSRSSALLLFSHQVRVSPGASSCRPGHWKASAACRSYRLPGLVWMGTVAPAPISPAHRAASSGPML